jgi:Uma2 family endonuclease
MEAFILKGSVTGSMADEEFLRFCLDNQDLRIERNSNLEIIIKSPVSTLSGLHSSEVFGQLANWSQKAGRGLAFDSSTGFSLPDRSVLSPDASWLLNTKWNKLSAEEKDKFAPVCPDFVIEVRSKTDDIESLKEKMKVWIRNGVQLAWLIDPRNNTSFIYRPGKAEETIEGIDKKIYGEGIVAGFVLDLSRLERINEQ